MNVIDVPALCGLARLLVKGMIVRGPFGGRFPDVRTFNSASDVYGRPSTSDNARSRMYCPVFGANATCCSVATLASVPTATGVPQFTPSRLT